MNFSYWCGKTDWWRQTDSLVIVLGDFNKGILSHELPKYRQLIKCLTREGEILDHCYTKVSIAYHGVRHQSSLKCSFVL